LQEKNQCRSSSEGKKKKKKEIGHERSGSNEFPKLSIFMTDSVTNKRTGRQKKKKKKDTQIIDASETTPKRGNGNFNTR